MKLARGTNWLILAVVGAWAAPIPARRGSLLVQRFIGHDQTQVYDACTERRPDCLVARQDTNEPQLSTSTQVPSSTMKSSFASSSTSGAVSASSSTSAPLSSVAQSTPSLTASDPSHFNNLAEQADPSLDSDGSDNHLRTVGIVGGFLAGTALVAIIGIILILIRNQRLRGSSVASSFRSRTRTRSGPRPPVMSESSSDHVSRLPQLSPLPPLRVHTGDGVTAASHDLTTAGTVGHQSAGMHQFPTTDVESASSRTTSFGPHSPGTSSGGSNAPRRAPQIPSLGLSNTRPFLRSFGSLFSYHASTGHPTPTPTRTALDREEQAENTEQTEQAEQTEATEVTAPSTFGSQTLAATEEMLRSDDHARTEETGMSEDIARTAETAHSGPAEASTDNQPKAS
ncbi:unnamed protein product [Rhizoctonia solani]|uniref:Mid2 domain-containing protein n=1 Tax=Rhizoctonia solani TaxID=456999 RepID=A0A8H3DEM9_9AGAM|nr:unnamed protein product [Rhizoctonia solani]